MEALLVAENDGQHGFSAGFKPVPDHSLEHSQLQQHAEQILQQRWSVLQLPPQSYEPEISDSTGISISERSTSLQPVQQRAQKIHAAAVVCAAADPSVLQ